MHRLNYLDRSNYFYPKKKINTLNILHISLNYFQTSTLTKALDSNSKTISLRATFWYSALSPVTRIGLIVAIKVYITLWSRAVTKSSIIEHRNPCSEHVNMQKSVKNSFISRWSSVFIWLTRVRSVSQLLAQRKCCISCNRACWIPFTIVAYLYQALWFWFSSHQTQATMSALYMFKNGIPFSMVCMNSDTLENLTSAGW